MLTPAQCDALVAVYELAGAATVPAVARRLSVSTMAARVRVRELVRGGWVTMERPLRRQPGARKIIVPSYPAAIKVRGPGCVELYRLVQLEPPAKGAPS